MIQQMYSMKREKNRYQGVGRVVGRDTENMNV